MEGDGFWVGPTVIDKVTPEMSVYPDEIFGPVLSVVRVPRPDAYPTCVLGEQGHEFVGGGADRDHGGDRHAP